MKPHLHTLVRIKGRPQYYRCILATCTSYFHKSYLEGKKVLCPKCGSEFTLSNNRKAGRRDLDTRMPVCDACSKSPARQMLARMRSGGADLVQDILNQREEYTLPNEGPKIKIPSVFNTDGSNPPSNQDPIRELRDLIFSEPEEGRTANVEGSGDNSGKG